MRDQSYDLCVVFAALNPLSCTAYKNTNSVNQRAEMKIDVDGSGPLRPFSVTCEFYGEHHTLILILDACRFSLTKTSCRKVLLYENQMILVVCSEYKFYTSEFPLLDILIFRVSSSIFTTLQWGIVVRTMVKKLILHSQRN